MNSDRSVQALKGSKRPINSFSHRKFILENLSSVDLVVEFDEETPEQLIKLIKPDVLVKGGDYTLDEIIGADLVKNYDGQVLIYDINTDYSTSETIERITTRYQNVKLGDRNGLGSDEI